MTAKVEKEEYELEDNCHADKITAYQSTSSSNIKNNHADVGYKLQKFRKLYTVDEARRAGKAVKSESKGGGGTRSNAIRKEYNFVYPSLLCNPCCWQGSCLIFIGDESYQNDCVNT